jgi:hypothetical protein
MYATQLWSPCRAFSLIDASNQKKHNTKINHQSLTMPSTKSLVLAFALVVTPAAHAAKFGLMGYENKADKGLSGLATIKAVNTGGVQIKGVLTAPETAGQQGPALMFVGQGTDCNAECTGEGAGGHDTFCLGGPPMGSENSWKVAGCQ